MTHQDRARLFLLVRQQAMNISVLRTKLRRGVISKQQYDAGLARADERINRFLNEKLPCSNT